MRAGLRKVGWAGTSRAASSAPALPSPGFSSLGLGSHRSHDSTDGEICLISTTEESAAIFIQTRYRGLKARMNLKARNAAALEAALKLQRAVRAPTTRGPPPPDGPHHPAPGPCSHLTACVAQMRYWFEVKAQEALSSQGGGSRPSKRPPGGKGSPGSSVGETMLHKLAEEGDHQGALNFIAQLGPHAPAELNKQDKYGRTPLMRAIDTNQTSTALLLLRLRTGSKVTMRDKHGRSSLSYAISRSNLPLMLALISNICGLAGNATDEVAEVLNATEISQLYHQLASIDAVKLGRAAALMFLTDPESTLLILVRAITAIDDKSIRLQTRDAARSQALKKSTAMVEAAAVALLHHSNVTVKPKPKPGETTAATDCSRQELASCIIRSSSSAVRLAIDFSCKNLLNQPFLVYFFQEQWSGALIQGSARDDDYAGYAALEPEPSKPSKLKRAPTIGFGKEASERDRATSSSSTPRGTVGVLADESSVHPKTEAPKQVEPQLSDYLVGMRVFHPKYGDGNVRNFLVKEGKVQIDFDNGDTHAYGEKSLHKIKIIDVANHDEIDSEEKTVSVVDVLLVAPAFALQALVMWVPLAAYPPLAESLKDRQPKWYYLEVPVLKFFSTFTGDLIFFFSLTFFSCNHSGGNGEGPYTDLVESVGRRVMVIGHLVWVAGILINEWGQFMSSKAAELSDLAELVDKMRDPNEHMSFLHGLKGVVALLFDVARIEDLIELCDLLGPLLAAFALVDEAIELTFRDESEIAALQTGDQRHLRVGCLATGLLLLGWRTQRLVMVSPSMGPLVLAVNAMILDVARWLVLQFAFLVGFTSALYALNGATTVSATGVYPDACELLQVSDYQGDRGGFFVWTRILVLMVENFLKQEADLECMRRYSVYMEPAMGLMVLFQLLSAVLMINMLIAMMAKTFDKNQEEDTVNFNYLRAKIISTWVESHPAPPPFNLLTLVVWKPISMILGCIGCKLTPKQLAAKARASTLAQAAKRATERSLGAEKSGSCSLKKGANRKSMADIGRSVTLTASAGWGRGSVKLDANPEHFTLVADYRNETHARKVSQLVTASILEATSVESAPGVEELRGRFEASVKSSTALHEKLIRQQEELAKATDAVRDEVVLLRKSSTSLKDKISGSKRASTTSGGTTREAELLAQVERLEEQLAAQMGAPADEPAADARRRRRSPTEKTLDESAGNSVQEDPRKAAVQQLMVDVQPAPGASPAQGSKVGALLRTLTNPASAFQ